MPRRTAAVRHHDSTPDPGAETQLIDVLIAIHHPTRRWLAELLWIEGPATVGMLAARTGLAVGSISHHLKTLHRHGFAEPAPELARDTRQSWWRGLPRRLTWSVDDFAPASPAGQIARSAEAENFRHQVRAVQQWFEVAGDASTEVRRLALSTDAYAPATPEEAEELTTALNDLLVSWSKRCREQAAAEPEVDRIPVRVFARVFPSKPVHP